MITITLDGLPCIPLTDELVASLAAFGEDISALNCLSWPVGASKWAKGVFLVHSSAAEQLASVDIAHSVAVVLKDDSLPESQGIITATMYQIEHRPVHLAKASDPKEGIYAVTLVDSRYFWAGINTTSSYDVTTTGDRTAYYTETTNTGSTWTWAGIIDHLGSLLSTFIDRSAVTDTVGDPTDFLLTYDPVPTTLDRICSALGMIFVADVAGGYYISTPNSLNANAIQHNTTFLRERMAGGYFRDVTTEEGKLWLNAIMPSSVVVRFPRQIPAGTDTASATNPPPLQQFYIAASTAGKPAGATGRTGYTITLDDALWAVGAIGSETNATALQARADYLATAYYNRWNTTLHDARLMGFINFGRVAGTITWRLTAGGAFTDIHVLDGLTDADESGRDMVIGLGGVQTHRTRDGALMVSGNGGNSTATFQITGNSTVNAMYTAKTFTGAGGTITLSSGTLTAASFGTIATANNALVMNTIEALGYSATGWDVTNTTNTFSTLGMGRIVGSFTDGTLIIHAVIPYTSCRAAS